MDALLPALIAVLLIAPGDRPAAYAAATVAAGRGHAWGVVTAWQLATIVVACAGGAWVRALLSPEARGVLLAGALVTSGVAALAARRGETVGSSLIAGAGLRVAGDRVGMIVFAVAAWGTSPVLTGVGAGIGVVAATGAAAAFADDWGRAPLPLLMRIAGVVVAVAGVVVGLGALRLA